MQKKCVACHSVQVKEVGILTSGKVSFLLKLPIKFAISPPKSKIRNYLCLDCGHINLYADDISIFKE